MANDEDGSREVEVNDPHGELVPQPHGGALRKGGKPGNAGGGRPSNEARRKAGEVLSAVMDRYAEMVTGRVEVEIAETCPECGYEGAKSAGSIRAYPDLLQQIQDKVSALQPAYSAPVDEGLVNALGGVVAFAVRDLDPQKQDEILAFINETWGRLVEEYNIKVAQG